MKAKTKIALLALTVSTLLTGCGKDEGTLDKQGIITTSEGFFDVSGYYLTMPNTRKYEKDVEKNDELVTLNEADLALAQFSGGFSSNPMGVSIKDLTDKIAIIEKADINTAPLVDAVKNISAVREKIKNEAKERIEKYEILYKSKLNILNQNVAKAQGEFDKFRSITAPVRKITESLDAKMKANEAEREKLNDAYNQEVRKYVLENNIETAYNYPFNGRITMASVVAKDKVTNGCTKGAFDSQGNCYYAYNTYLGNVSSLYEKEISEIAKKYEDKYSILYMAWENLNDQRVAEGDKLVALQIKATQELGGKTLYTVSNNLNNAKIYLSNYIDDHSPYVKDSNKINIHSSIYLEQIYILQEKYQVSVGDASATKFIAPEVNKVSKEIRDKEYKLKNDMLSDLGEVVNVKPDGKFSYPTTDKGQFGVIMLDLSKTKNTKCKSVFFAFEGSDKRNKVFSVADMYSRCMQESLKDAIVDENGSNVAFGNM